MLNLSLTSNEPRAKYLFDVLKEKVTVSSETDFDDIDPITKYVAAALSFKMPKSEWWGNYQMHPLIQRRRRKVLLQQMNELEKPDALLMWGSWFHPFKDTNLNIPFYVYIDQSRSLKPTSFEPETSEYGRKKSYDLQVETYKACSGIFCMSEWAKKQTIESHPYLDDSKVHVLGWGPCGIDLAREEIDFSAKESLVLHISNDFMRKGIDYLLETAKACYASNPYIKFVVIGDDATYTPPTDIPPNVEFLGRIMDRNKLNSYFAKASLFFMPHRFDRNPHVLVEAMGAGLPLIASRQGGAIELIENREIGSLCDIGDISAYSSEILGYLSDKNKIHNAGKAGKLLANEFYTWDAIANRAIAIMS